ncbi:MAG: acetyl-CoA carboxylase biotin carboxyl carrier protein, partial [Flavobacteriales bacterium]
TITSSPVDTPSVQSTPERKNTNEEDNSNYITIKSSMIGTFYRSSSPEKPSFVNIGDSIKEGDPICIIEAMKLFNEIESEVSGTIVKVLVDDATPIE